MLGGDGQALSPKRTKLLRQALAELPDHERVIAEADLADPTGTASAALLAKKLGYSPSTVCSRRKHDRDRLRQILTGAGAAKE